LYTTYIVKKEDKDMKKLVSIFLVLVLMTSSFVGCAKKDTTDTSKTPAVTSAPAEEASATEAPQQDVTIKVAAIETAYGVDMWTKVTEAFTAKTGIKVELTTDKSLEDVIGAQMKAGDYPDVIHLATGRPAGFKYDRSGRRQEG
jgi:N-acetylglucosamine transport system substrate-binding protein